MSGKSSKAPKKLSVPRTLVEIEKEYSQVVAGAGQAQYVITIKQEELSDLNKRLRALNNEAHARRQLDVKTEIQETVANAATN